MQTSPRFDKVHGRQYYRPCRVQGGSSSYITGAFGRRIRTSSNMLCFSIQSTRLAGRRYIREAFGFVISKRDARDHAFLHLEQNWWRSRASSGPLSVADGLLGESGLIRSGTVLWKDTASLKLRRRAHILWKEGGPKNVLIVKKPHNKEATAALYDVGKWLIERGIQPFIEHEVNLRECPDFPSLPSRTEDIDLCITLGGDGTVLHLASLFVKDEALPPVISFAMGTLGFLTPFDMADFRKHLTNLLLAEHQGVPCTLRTRKRCEVYTPFGQFVSVHHVLNECIIDRGHSTSTLTVEIFVDGQYITTVTADGLIVATPSGSTAYSMTAGGPMAAPSVPCTLITPVAPLSLSFRPLVLPESSDIVMHAAEHSKSSARACFDGKQQARLARGSSVHISTSLFPLPLINMGELDSDWYEGITQKLKWNQSIIDPPRKPIGVPNGSTKSKNNSR